MSWLELVGGALRPREDAAHPRLVAYQRSSGLPDAAYPVLARPQHQLSAGSCLAHGEDLLLASEVLGRTGAVLQLCRLDLYYGARWLVGDEARDVGAYPDRMAQWVRTYGTVSEVRKAYDPGVVTTWRPPAEWAAERRLLTAEMADVPRDVDQLKVELAAGRGILLCHNVDAQLVDEAGRTGVERGMTGPSLGGHARVVAGYDNARGAFLVANSWKGWGVPHPMAHTQRAFSAWTHGCSWVPYKVMVDPAWGWSYQRVLRGLEVEA